MANDRQQLQVPSGCPRIVPVADGTKRPFWSVMIPTYNCAAYLRETLASVLSQDPGEERMQIEVVDDCSTKDDPEAVVMELGKGRVQFYRQPKNGGAITNFNTCIRRSCGRWVHILHGDDYVLQGFYAAIEDAIRQSPDVGFVATRALIVDAQGELEGMMGRVQQLEQGGHAAAGMLYSNLFQFPGVVVRRSTYEQTGGFCQELVHTADWEMWVRAISTCGGKAVNRPLACYRIFEGNDTSRLTRTGENLRDYSRLMAVFRERFSQFDRRCFASLYLQLARTQSHRFRLRGDAAAAKAADVAARPFMAVLGYRSAVRDWTPPRLQAWMDRLRAKQPATASL